MSSSELGEDLEGFQVQAGGFLDKALFPLDVGEVVERICVGGTQPQCRVVALLRLLHLPFLLERVGEVAVRIGEVRLQLDSTAICVDSQVDESLLVVDARQVSVYDGIVWGKV